MATITKEGLNMLKDISGTTFAQVRVKYLTVAEYATEKRVSVRVIRAEIAKGRIPAEKIGREYRIPVPD
jgi:excisionase family DNA binding protein